MKIIKLQKNLIIILQIHKAHNLHGNELASWALNKITAV